MHRRTFLQAFSALPALGITAANAAVDAVPTSLARSDTEAEFPEHRLDNLDQGAVVNAAFFPSVLWTRARCPAPYEKQWLQQRQRDFPNATLPKIKNGRLIGHELPAPDLAIALAHPDDPLSWNAALDQCRSARSRGALTVLVAAREYPRYPLDARAHVHRENDPSRAGAGLVLNITTMSAYAALTNILGLFTTCLQGGYIALDFADMRFVLGDSQNGYLFSSDSRGATRARIAANDVCQQISSHPMPRNRTRNAFIAMEVDSQFELQELHDVYVAIQQVMPQEDNVVVACTPWSRSEAHFRVHVLVTT